MTTPADTTVPIRTGSSDPPAPAESSRTIPPGAPVTPKIIIVHPRDTKPIERHDGPSIGFWIPCQDRGGCQIGNSGYRQPAAWVGGSFPLPTQWPPIRPTTSSFLNIRHSDAEDYGSRVWGRRLKFQARPPNTILAGSFYCENDQPLVLLIQFNPHPNPVPDPYTTALFTATRRGMLSVRSCSFWLFLTVCAVGEVVQAFVPPHATTITTITTTTTTGTRPTSQLKDSTGWDNFCVEDEDNRSALRSSPEIARRFRRTVYTHDDWKKHRQQDRFTIYLGSMFKSGVFENSKNEVIVTTAFATFVCIYNALVGGYTDLVGVAHPPPLPGQVVGLPVNAFSLTGSSLGLLLTFRANASYKRWDEARKNWGSNINRTRDLVRMANCYYDRSGVDPERRADDLKHVALCTWAFVRAMKRHLSPQEEDEFAFQLELREKLPRDQAEMIISAAHRPNRALQDLSFAIDQLPMHFIRKNEINSAVTQFEDNLGSSERLLTSPVPLVYSRHTARFITVWLFLSPLGLWNEFKGSWNHISMIPATFFIALFMFGIEELAAQLEEPFTILPMQAFCDKIYNWCNEIMSWSPGDNGRPMKPIKPEHELFYDPMVMK